MVAQRGAFRIQVERVWPNTYRSTIVWMDGVETVVGIKPTFDEAYKDGWDAALKHILEGG